MQNKDFLELDGIVSEAIPNTMFRIQIDATAPEDYAGRTLLCTLNGKMRKFRIRVMPGDRVKIEVTPYDKNRGRVIFRSK